MKNKILPFIKTYPMSILLAIIAINLISIGGSLKTSAKLDQKKLICLESREIIEQKLGKGKNYQCNILNN